MPEVADKAHTRAFTMSDDHKASLAVGREQSRIVRGYLNALEGHHPRRGRKRTAESVQHRLDEVVAQIEIEEDPLRRLQLIAEREQLETDLEFVGSSEELADLEADFIKVVRDFSDRKNISYSAWRAIGVDAAVLRRAGLTRAS